MGVGLRVFYHYFLFFFGFFSVVLFCACYVFQDNSCVFFVVFVEVEVWALGFYLFD